MPTIGLIIDHRNTQVRCDRKTLLITRGNNKPQRLPIKLLENVVVIGNPTVESNVWRALAEAGIPATLLPGRGNQPPAILTSGLSITLPLRRLQYRCAEQQSTALPVARWILDRKLDSYRLPLARLQPAPKDLKRFNKQREKAQQQLTQTPTIEGLMGVEGSIANSWFGQLTTVLPPQWRFSGRNRRPPRDPVNALLSLGYTLLMSDVHQIIISEGMDPALGFLHQPFPAREALTLDITELYRAGVDDFVLTLLKKLKPTNFNYHKDTGCRLNKQIRPHFYNHWAEHRQNWPRVPAKENPAPTQSASLQEQLRGHLMELRQILKTTLQEKAT